MKILTTYEIHHHVRHIYTATSLKYVDFDE